MHRVHAPAAPPGRRGAASTVGCASWRRTRSFAAILLAMASLLGPQAAQAQTFSQSVAQALKADAEYAAAIVGVANREIAAKEAAASFYPSARIGYAQPEVGQRKGVATVVLTQPIVSYDRYLNRQQVDPITAQAQVQARQARDDLHLRVYRTMADAIRAREAIRTIDVQLRGLGEQLQRARRMRELGQGTITEVSDFEVRLAVAQANRVGQVTALQRALRTYTRITGVSAVTADTLEVSDAPGQVSTPATEERDFVAAVLDTSAAVQAARLAVRLQEIAARRSRAKYLPVLNASVSRGSDGSSSGGVRFGLTLEAPLSAGSLYEDQRATNELQQAKDRLLVAEQTAASDAATLWQSIVNQTQEVEIRRRAVDVARMALEANIKSYEGGVKSNIDVVTSYQNLADSENALVNSQLGLLESRLQQRLLLQPLEADPRR